MSVLTVPGRVRGQSGASAPTLPKAYVVDPNAVWAFLARLRADHRNCPCSGLNVRCRVAEKKFLRGLAALAAGGTVADALDAAGPFGIQGSVEVMQ